MSRRGWTYGVEHEFADWDVRQRLPEGCQWNHHDYTIVNDTGIANDPSGRLYGLGGEINTRPTDWPEGQMVVLQKLKEALPDAAVNYRSNLHVHVRVPGLCDNLALLKRVQRYIHQWAPELLPQLHPELSERPHIWDGLTPEEFAGAVRRWRRMRVSHQTLLTEHRLDKQMRARTVGQFFEAEVPRDRRGRAMWHAQPRVCVNLRQLRETDTVEFRHFFGTTSAQLLFNAVEYCAQFLERALAGEEPPVVPDLPRAAPYSHWHEVRYRATCHDGSNCKADIEANIRAIEEGTWPLEAD